jgi:hypothetical protein
VARNAPALVAQRFSGLLTREFGEDAFAVDRVTEPPAESSATRER